MKYTLLKQFFILAVFAPVVLNSCQSAITSAAQRGDLAKVRQAISAGVSVRDLNEAAAAAYAQEHEAVLAELVKAGAVVAPDSVAYKSIIFRDVRSWVDKNADWERPDLTPGGFDAYWNEYVWKINWQRCNDVYFPTTCDGQLLAWKSGNFVEVKKNHEGGIFISETEDTLEYRRADVNTAFVTCGGSWMTYSRARADITLYKLTFTSPNSGKFQAIGQSSYDGTEWRNEGNFWLKDASDSQN